MTLASFHILSILQFRIVFDEKKYKLDFDVLQMETANMKINSLVNSIINI